VYSEFFIASIVNSCSLKKVWILFIKIRLFALISIIKHVLDTLYYTHYTRWKSFPIVFSNLQPTIPTLLLSQSLFTIAGGVLHILLYYYIIFIHIQSFIFSFVGELHIIHTQITILYSSTPIYTNCIIMMYIFVIILLYYIIYILYINIIYAYLVFWNLEYIVSKHFNSNTFSFLIYRARWFFRLEFNIIYLLHINSFYRI